MSVILNAHISNESEQAENIFSGLAAAKGIAIGKVFVFSRHKVHLDEGELIENQVNDEIERLKLALERSEKELQKIAGVTEQTVGHTYSDIFTAQIMMLHDDVFIGEVRRRIATEHKHASIIVSEEISKYQKLLLSQDEILFHERADDIQDLKERIIRNLHSGQIFSRIPENAVVVADSLTPADVILFSRQTILGCATEGGGLTSHAALICQSLDVPMVIGVPNISETARNDDTIIIDGFSGSVILNPFPQTIEFYERKQKRNKVSQATIDKLASEKTKTLDGKRIYAFTNLDFKEEAVTLEKFGSEGVGLYRTENLFLSGGKQPTEEEQFEYYSELASAIAPKPLTLRLFDVGGDKLLFSSYKEMNPNLGWRGVRILIDVPEVLENQLRALLRANVHGNIRVMIPMVSSMDEIRFIKKVFAKIKQTYHKEKLNDKILFGAMIEVPAAVEIIDDITKEVDFVSIGTNDLIQYTLAVDRNNEIVQNLYNKFHPAIVRMLGRIIKTAKKNKCKVAMCGEMASDKVAIPLLLGLGLEEFSMVSSAIPNFKTIVGTIKLTEAKKIAKSCLTHSTAYEIEHELKHFKMK